MIGLLKGRIESGKVSGLNLKSRDFKGNLNMQLKTLSYICLPSNYI